LQEVVNVKGCYAAWRSSQAFHQMTNDSLTELARRGYLLEKTYDRFLKVVKSQNIRTLQNSFQHNTWFLCGRNDDLLDANIVKFQILSPRIVDAIGDAVRFLQRSTEQLGVIQDEMIAYMLKNTPDLGEFNRRIAPGQLVRGKMRYRNLIIDSLGETGSAVDVVKRDSLRLHQSDDIEVMIDQVWKQHAHVKRQQLRNNHDVPPPWSPVDVAIFTQGWPAWSATMTDQVFEGILHKYNSI
jgi:hypothetical protein